MGNEQALLRMLEPAVRPTGVPEPRVRPQRPMEQRSFDEVLRGLADRPLKFSANAQQKLADRGIELSDAQVQALKDATDKAEMKGARDALMLMNRLGLIVNVPNRTVLTVLGEDRMSGGVITQIDSAVMVDDPAANEPAPHRLRL